MVYLDARPASAAILNGDSRQLSSPQAPKLEISYYSHVSWFDYLQATVASAAEYTLTYIAPPHPDLWSFSVFRHFFSQDCPRRGRPWTLSMCISLHGTNHNLDNYTRLLLWVPYGRPLVFASETSRSRHRLWIFECSNHKTFVTRLSLLLLTVGRSARKYFLLWLT